MTLLSAKNSLSLDLNGIKLIEASAGTGKTYTISNLYCRFILQGTPVQNILLVTFTIAATEELKQRIRQRLKTIHDLYRGKQTNSGDEFLQLLKQAFDDKAEQSQETELNRLNLAIRSFDEAAIHTINGFCQRMLNDYAFYSAQHYELNLQTNDDDLWQAAVKDWWRKNSYELSHDHFALFIASLKNLKSVIKQSKNLRNDGHVTIKPSHHDSLDNLYILWETQKTQIAELKTLWQQHRSDVVEFFESHKIFKKNTKQGDKVMVNLELIDVLLSQECLFLNNDINTICHSVIKKNTLKAHIDQHDFVNHQVFLKADEILNQQNALLQQFTASALLNAVEYAEQHVNKAKLSQHSLTFNDQLVRLHQGLNDSSQAQLASQIRQKFPVALIDEFQDTNAIQYSIFDILYSNQSDVSLIMIGDPKQAIYSFRGGDIFTYMTAKKQVGDELYSLSSNWRSTPELIDAVNRLFSNRADAFIYTDAMPFEPVVSGSKNTPKLSRFNKNEVALKLWDLPEKLTVDSAKKLINSQVANEICELINEGNAGTALLGKEPVKAADIAVLVRSNFEGKEISDALKKRGVHAINIGKDRVFQSDAAHGLLLLMKGIAQADESQSVRNMLASRLFSFNYQQIKNIINTEEHWVDWLNKANTLQKLWLNDGFILMFYSMLRLLKINENLAQQDNAERQLTNLLHCAEKIQEGSKINASPQALCHWLSQKIQQPNSSSEDDELRLESDAQLVKIVTVHKSKGLEYPIIFVPYLWRSKAVSSSQDIYKYHDSQRDSVIDFVFDEPQRKQAYLNADQERIAEDMRLLYVALTRARSKCYLVTGQVGGRSGSKNSALSFLLHPIQASLELSTAQADISKYAKKHDLAAEIKLLAESSNNTISYQLLDESNPVIKSTEVKNNSTLLSAKSFKGNLNFDWTISSFSRMTRDIHQVAHGGHQSATDDEIFNFKRGGDAGTFLHHILELIDFTGDIELQSSMLFDRFAQRYHLESEQNKKTVQLWMAEVINTRLNDTDLSLSQIKKSHCIDELEFDFSLQTVDINALNQFLIDRTQQRSSLLHINNFKGMMTGFIDLVFEHEGKYYVADYKSNFLGNELGDYTPAKLNQAIIDRRYDLQYLLYSLALHRYLKYRIPNYSYEQHFGGVYYLFLRAMRVTTGPEFGVFFDCPTSLEITDLDERIFKSASSGVGVDGN